MVHDQKGQLGPHRQTQSPDIWEGRVVVLTLQLGIQLAKVLFSLNAIFQARRANCSQAQRDCSRVT
eukprot:1160123-Pelagomonas_calceolata.AAC.5